jgi:alginate O-acetyltransferase complex protein AlgI
MLFSSLLFLYLFLPVTLFGYYFSPQGIKNYWLLLASLIFFAWGGVSLTTVLLLSIFLNYCFGRLIARGLPGKTAYIWLATGVSANILLLCVFKYLNFAIYNFNDLLGSAGIPEIRQTSIVLPIGISFYTFHAVSYLVDIYRGKTPVQKNILDLALYICMFSQLIAGPIIRYNDVWQQLGSRTHSVIKFASGIERFLIGLGKKVLLANTFAKVADDTFSMDASNLDALNAWLGIICYSLQIYCDFAGYSDMAIGLGRMFGFEFKENFNFPYISRSVKEFWRRWHISLSSFFRDYVYIPLGGNRVSTGRQYLNLLIVFFLTGFWHGASWSFVVWGLFHGFFIIVERLGFEKLLLRTWKPLSILYTSSVVVFAWVLFRSADLDYAIGYWRSLFSFTASIEQYSRFFRYFNLELVVCLSVALLGSWGFFSKLQNKFEHLIAKENPPAKITAYVYHVSSVGVYAAILFLCTLSLLSGSYNPFIYYRF